MLGSKLIICALVFSISLMTSAQSEKIEGKLYKIKIERIQGKVAEGYLYDCSGSEIQILPSRIFNPNSIQSIPVENIRRIKVRKKGSIGTGIVTGAVAGSLAGFFIGYSDGDDEPGWFSMSKEDKAAGGAFVGAAIGGGAGALIGWVGKRFEISFDPDLLMEVCEEIKPLGAKTIHGL